MLTYILAKQEPLRSVWLLIPGFKITQEVFVLVLQGAAADIIKPGYAFSIVIIGIY